ncbi:nickel-dependent lactate racemase [bacterium]|nr:nickel-dependent lactate racemase [bacterium]
MPEFELRYGDGIKAVSIPAGIDTVEIRPRSLFKLENPRNEILRTLRNPIGARRLAEAVRGKKKICLIVSDNTRKCLYPLTLPILFEEMVGRGGVNPRDVTILIALGTHRKMSAGELKEHLGSEIVKKFKIEQHDGSNPDKMRRAGRTERGTILYYNPIAATADFIILAGSITYHYFAGFTGGRKMLFPGVAANESIIQNHSLTIDRATGDFHERVKPGSLLGNPVHEDMLDAASELRPDFLMDVVLNPDGELSGVFAGDFSYAHRLGCQFVENHFGFVVDDEEIKHAEIVIASAGGSPRDINFYQVHKSLVNATNILNPGGGTLILLAECGEGMGHPGFESWKALKASDDIRMKLTHNYSPIGHLVLSLRKRTEQHRIFLISSLAESDVTTWGMTPAKSVSQALGEVFSKLRPPFPPVTIMPHASLTTPIGVTERVGITSKEMEAYFGTGDEEDADGETGKPPPDDDDRSDLAKEIFGG